MEKTVFGVIYLVCMVAAYLARVPSLISVSKTMKKEDRKSVRQKFETEGMLLGLLMVAWYLAACVMPFFYVFGSRLDFANYRLPSSLGIIGSILFLLAIALLLKAHSDLGRAWSSTVQIQQEQPLVTDGIYKFIRHPIYAAHILWGIAGVLLLHSWIVGWSGLVLFVLVYLVRVPNEEKLMLDKFSDAYREYMQTTGRIIPKF
jgi:protein-S-isoprenylcysteine O-methyltransferase Ste14